MKYILKVHAFGKYPEIEIDKDRYYSICNAKDALINGLDMEEKYEILVSNYLELETQILRYATQSMARNPHDYEDFHEVRMEFNIRMVNLLTAARLYRDQLHRHLIAIVPTNSSIKNEIDRLFSIEYDQNVHFRFMEELRNYVQHKGIPVHWTQHSAYRDDIGKDSLVTFSMELGSKKEFLKEDKKFKKKVLNELPDKIDLKIATRSYIGSISKVHCSARKLVEIKLHEARSIIECARSEYQKVYPKKFVGLSAMCVEEDIMIDSKSILLDWDDIRLKLTNKNTELVNLTNRCVTGKSRIS